MSDEKLEQAVFKIFRMTHEGKLVWSMKPAPAPWTLGTDSLIPLYFETVYQGRKLAVFQERRRSGACSRRTGGSTSEATDDWSQRIRLALLGDHDEIMFDFPDSRQINGLFDAVRYKESNIEQFLDALLNTESDYLQK